MVERTILTESVTLGEALLTGLVLGIYYDVFRIIRRIIHCGYANIVAQDLFFWSTSAVFTFFVSIKLCDGKVRIIFLAAALAGWMLYMMTVGSIVMFLAERIIRITKRVGRGIHNFAILPLVNNAKNRYNARKNKKNKEIDDNLKIKLEKAKKFDIIKDN